MWLYLPTYTYILTSDFEKFTSFVYYGPFYVCKSQLNAISYLNVTFILGVLIIQVGYKKSASKSDQAQKGGLNKYCNH